MIALVGMIALLVVGLGVGYFLNSGSTEVVSGDLYPEDSEWRTGSISLAGSTTVLPIAETASLAFMNIYTGATVTVQGGGSGTGYASALDGTVDIGMGSRGPKQSEIDAIADQYKNLLISLRDEKIDYKSIQKLEYFNDLTI